MARSYACDRCGKVAPADELLYSAWTGSRYCLVGSDECDAKAAKLAAVELQDPEYADVDSAGQPALGVPGEQRSIVGLAPGREEGNA